MFIFIHGGCEEYGGDEDDGEMVVETDVVEALISSEIIYTCIEYALNEVSMEQLGNHQLLLIL